MIGQPASAVLCILEIASLDLQRTSAQLRTHLESLGLPVRVIGELNGYPSIVVETDDSISSRLRELLEIIDFPIEIVKLRHHFHPPMLSTDHLVEIINECNRDQRLAIGAGTVERAIQRRRLELLVLAKGVTESYTSMMQAVVRVTRYQGPLVVADLTSKELGCAAGVHRTGCVGILRSSSHIVLSSRQVH